MSVGISQPSVPDLAAGIDLDQLADGAMLAGRVGDTKVLLARRGDEIFAVGAVCTHYGGPLSKGLLVDDTVRCPWHHACFSLRTGEPLRAPALKPIPCFDVMRANGRIRVIARRAPIAPPTLPTRPGLPASIVIVGGGAAGHAAAQTLRKEGFAGRLTILSADAAPPYDRPNLSKSYLKGAAPDSSNPLHEDDFYRNHAIDLKLGVSVGTIDPSNHVVELTDGRQYSYDALLLATGAEPVRLDLEGGDKPHVHYLRTLADAHALNAEAGKGRRVVVIGSSFIGLEVAASLRTRGVQVHVVAPETIPMHRILGPDLGAYIKRLHERHGVTFHLGTTVATIRDESVTLENGETIETDFVVVGIGVRPRLALAEQAGLTLDHGVVVDSYLQTSIPGIFAAGDIVRWPDKLSAAPIRVEHWIVAERQGQTAARNMLGQQQRFDSVPFFWTEQYDFNLSYLGHAQEWDESQIEGSLEEGDCTITYRGNGRTLAQVFINRDLAGLKAERAFEQAMAQG